MVSIRARYLSILSCLLVIQAGCFAGSNAAEKVSLDLYYESLCPYCANFIVNLLPAIFENGLIDIIDLKFYPWGNAKITSGDGVKCQHGPYECLLNEVDACALDVWPTLSEHFPFIYCTESLAFEGKYTKWDTCFQKLGLDSKPVYDCYYSGKGKKLMIAYGAVTNALEPRKEYVPWVVVDGTPLKEDYDEFMSAVCKAYKGTPPSACSELSVASVRKNKFKHAHPICYAQQETVKESFLPFTVSSIRHTISAALAAAV